MFDTNVWQFTIMPRYGKTAEALKNKLKDRPNYVLQVGIQLIEQLKYIHEAGYLHNNIKMSHIIVEPFDEQITKCVRLIDFSYSTKYRLEGVYHDMMKNIKSTNSKNLVMKTSNQLRGQPNTRRDDLICLGYSMLMMAGKLPYHDLFKDLIKSKPLVEVKRIMME